MKDLSDFLKDFVTPRLKPFGFRKKGKVYRLDAESGDSTFIGFAPVRIDPRAVVFHVQCSFVPEPYWQFLNQQYMLAGVPAMNQSGALASYSVMPPESVAHEADSSGLFRTRWAFDDGNRAEAGRVLGEVLVAEVSRIQYLLVRQNLLAAIRSSETPVIRRRGALKSELLIKVDEYSREKTEDLLSRIDEGDAFIELFTRWADMRRRLLA